MDNNSFLSKFQGRTEIIGKNGIFELANKNYSYDKDEKIKPRKIENLILKLKNKHKQKQGYQISSMNSSHNNNKKSKSKERKMPLSINSSRIIKNSNSSGNIKVKNRNMLNNNKMGNNNVKVVINDNKNLRNKKNNYINNGANQGRIINSSNQKKKNNNLFQRPNLGSKSNQNKINNYKNKNNIQIKINENRNGSKNKNVKLPVIVTSPLPNNSKNYKKNILTKSPKRYKRQNSSNFNSSDKSIKNKFQKINKNYYSERRPQSLKHSSLDIYNNQKRHKLNAYQEKPVDNKIKLFKNYAKTPSSNYLTDKNINISKEKNYKSQNKDQKFKIQKSQSFGNMNMNRQIKYRNNLLNNNVWNKSINDYKENVNNRIFNINDYQNNALYLNNLNYMNNMNNNTNQYNNIYNNMFNNMNSFNINNNLNNHINIKSNIKSNILPKKKMKKGKTITDYIKNFEINEISNKNVFVNNKNSYTSFDNKPKPILPSIRNKFKLKFNNNNNKNEKGNDNILDLEEENKPNIVDILMKQRLLFQNKIPDNSRFKLKPLNNTKNNDEIEAED